MSLPLHLRSYREKSKDEVNRDFFNVPTQESLPVPGDPPSAVKIRHKEGSGVGAGMQGMDINAVLSVEGKEEVYVSQSGGWHSSHHGSWRSGVIYADCRLDDYP